MVKFLLPLFIFHSVVMAKIAPIKEEKTELHDLKKVEKKLDWQEKNLKRLERQLKGLERKLGKGQKRYLKVYQRKRKFEDEVEEIKIELRQSQVQYQQIENELQKYMRHLVVSRFDQSENSLENLIETKVLNKRSQKLAKELRDKKAEAKQFLLKIGEVEKNYKIYFKTEEDVAFILEELEKKKNLIAKKYMQALRDKDELSAIKHQLMTLDKVKEEKIQRGINLSLPLKKYLSISHGNKGVTFEYSQKMPLYAPAAGKVIHEGHLASYGRVLMIQHNNQYKTILLGPFLPKVKKGDQLEKDSIIGMTSTQNLTLNKPKGKIYFEVRKSNKVQNTALFLDINTKKKVL